jgi:ribonucleoside-diphosphate reductase alpha chain/ribonucleoside-triphosphate reductase
MAAEELGWVIKPEVGQTLENCTTKVIEFPCKAPAGKTKFDVTAIEQLENYKRMMDNFVDHNVSITVSVKEHEWDDVEEWVWNHWDEVVALSFLPLNDAFYELAPYEKITKEEYEERSSKMKRFVPSLISK